MDPPLAAERADAGAAAHCRAAARWTCWLALTVLAAVLLAWGAVAVQQRFAPLLLLPILLGAALGLIVARLALACRLRGAVLVIAVAGLAGGLLVPAMQVISWLEYRATYEEQQRGKEMELKKAILSNSRLAALAAQDVLPPPPGFRSFLRGQAALGRDWFGGRRSGVVVWWSWGLDALLAAGTAAASAGIFQRRE